MEKLSIKFAIEDGYNVIAPERKTEGSAGWDFHIPEFTSSFIQAFEANTQKIAKKEEEACDKLRQLEWPSNKFPYIEASTDPDPVLVIPPQSRAIIPSGIRLSIPEGYVVEAANRGGLSSLYGLVHGACIIDQDYTGMVFLSVINTGNTPVVLAENQSLIQVLVRKVEDCNFTQIDISEITARNTERGEGCLGHTDKK